LVAEPIRNIIFVPVVNMRNGSAFSIHYEDVKNEWEAVGKEYFRFR